MDRGDPEQIYESYRGVIEQSINKTARRRLLSNPERDVFSAYVYSHLTKDNYALIRKFANRSTVWTYLAAVIERLSLDFRVAQWNEWRPSAIAERHGAIGMLLERLVLRDKHSIDEAIEIARTQHNAAFTADELLAIWAVLEAKKKFPPQDGT